MVGVQEDAGDNEAAVQTLAAALEWWRNSMADAAAGAGHPQQWLLQRLVQVGRFCAPTPPFPGPPTLQAHTHGRRTKFSRLRRWAISCPALKIHLDLLAADADDPVAPGWIQRCWRAQPHCEPCGGLQAKVAVGDVAGARALYDQMASAGGESTAAQAEALASLATAMGLRGEAGAQVGSPAPPAPHSSCAARRAGGCATRPPALAPRRCS